MIGEDLFDLNEQAARWRWMTEQVRDKRALSALQRSPRECVSLEFRGPSGCGGS